jgi:hypothetical protein
MVSGPVLTKGAMLNDAPHKLRTAAVARHVELPR